MCEPCSLSFGSPRLRSTPYGAMEVSLSGVDHSGPREEIFRRLSVRHQSQQARLRGAYCDAPRGFYGTDEVCWGLLHYKRIHEIFRQNISYTISYEISDGIFRELTSTEYIDKASVHRACRFFSRQWHTAHAAHALMSVDRRWGRRPVTKSVTSAADLQTAVTDLLTGVADSLTAVSKFRQSTHHFAT